MTLKFIGHLTGRVKMTNPFHTPFVAVFQNEVLLNSKRVAPYALIILFSAHAVLWWGWSAAATYGWATNGDYNIVRNLQGFSLLGLPIFTALIMGDAVIRDFRIGVDPLVFSKPVSRSAYLLGKFFGNFFVLVCCQSTFALTMLLLQWFPLARVVVLPVRVFPYFKHFFFLVVISHLFLAAIYFTVGTLTRNAKIVYASAVAFYPLYIAYGVLFLKELPRRWGVTLDPMLVGFNSVDRVNWEDADGINRIVISYSSDLFANRVGVILIVALVLTLLYFRFSIAERPGKAEEFSTLGLSTAAEGVYYDSESFKETSGPPSRRTESPETLKTTVVTSVPLPAVNTASVGIRAHLNKLIAALGVEFRLLRSERSLVVILPLAMLLSFLSLPFQAAFSGETYSAAFASRTASGLLVFLLGVIVFYTGEAMHRDREVRIEPVLWSMPAPNSVLLLSKFLLTISLTLVLIVLVGLTAIATQLLRGHTPVEIQAYLITYSVILLPSIVFMAGTSLALNVLLRDKYLAYAVSIGTGAGLFYLYSIGYNHWLYNPLLYQLWKYADLTGAGNNHVTILTHRIYCLAIGGMCLALAHLFFERRSTMGLTIGGRLRGNGWSILMMVISAAIALIAGLVIDARE